MSQEVNEPVASYGDFYTYADYLKWDIKERVEIIKGKLFKMSPAPSTSHQRISRNIAAILLEYLKKKQCELFIAPFDVRLVDSRKASVEDEEIYTVFQPDLCVICDSEKLDERGCLGAPDFIIEILSPGNSKREMDVKYTLYEENGVKEYWVVDYQNRFVHRYVLEGNKYIGLQPITEDGEVSSQMFPDLKFSAIEVYRNL